MSENNREAMEGHWAKTRTLTFIVLAIWFIFSFVVHWFANSLNGISFLGFPLGYYFAVQGSLAIFVILIFVQNWRQDQIDEEFGVSDKE
ncbi:MAG: DUF4212 domain-containing protein [Pseudomonadota bacterium]